MPWNPDRFAFGSGLEGDGLVVNGEDEEVRCDFISDGEVGERFSCEGVVEFQVGDGLAEETVVDQVPEDVSAGN